MLQSVDPRLSEVFDDQLADFFRIKTPAERVEMISAAYGTARLPAATSHMRQARFSTE